MALFRFIVLDDQNRVITSTADGPVKHEEAPDRELLLDLIRQRGLKPLLVEEISSGKMQKLAALQSKMDLKRWVTYHELEMFCRIFEILLPAGITVDQAFDLALQETENQWFKQHLLAVQKDLVEGVAFSAALRKHPKAFSNLMVATVEAGEHSGNLPQVMGRLANMFKNADKLKRDVTTALTYPGFVFLFFNILIVMIVLTTPQVIGEFLNVNADRVKKLIPHFPAVIRFCFWVSFHPAIWLVPITVTLTPVLMFVVGKKYAASRLLLARMVHKIPLLGRIIHYFALTQMLEVTCLMQDAGVETPKALDVMKSTSDHAIIEEGLEQVKLQVMKGMSRPSAMRREKIFPKLLVELLQSGEEAGNVSTMLRQVAEYYYNVAKATTDRLVSLIDPIMIIGMGAIVGPVILALYKSLFIIRELYEKGLL